MGTSEHMLLSGKIAIDPFDSYIREILSPLISKMLEMPADRSYELDPKRPDGRNVEENAKSLSIIAQAFLHVICDSAPALPP
jgi:neurofibromin 1